METFASVLAGRYLTAFPTGKSFLTPEELPSDKLPRSLYDRLQMEFEMRLDRDLLPPRTSWSDLENPDVKAAWEAFVGEVRDRARLPMDDLEQTLNRVAGELLEQLVHPRRAIPESLFGGDDTLDRETLERRSDSITVYRHLATAPGRFMERKGLERLGREQCERVIAAVDEKLTERYNLLEWADLLEPLFRLFDDEVPVELLRLFFEEKKRMKTARLFDRLEGSVNRAGLIERLSSPELLEGAGEEQEQSNLFDEEAPLHSRFSFDQPDLNRYVTDRGREKDEAANPKSVDDSSGKTGSPSDEDPDRALPSDEEPARAVPSGSVTASEARDRVGDRNSKKQEPEDSGRLSVHTKGERREPPAVSDEETHQSAEEGSAEEDEGAIWKRFLSPEADTEEPEIDKELETPAWQRWVQEEPDIEESSEDEETPEPGKPERSGRSRERLEAEKPEKPEESKDTAGSGEEEIVEVEKHLPSATYAGELAAWLGEESERFVEELFHGSEQAFDSAMQTLGRLDTWKDAANFIQNDIFLRNRVDLFDDAAVDFTDRMQEWFEQLEQKSS